MVRSLFLFFVSLFVFACTDATLPVAERSGEENPENQSREASGNAGGGGGAAPYSKAPRTHSRGDFTSGFKTLTAPVLSPQGPNVFPRQQVTFTFTGDSPPYGLPPAFEPFVLSANGSNGSINGLTGVYTAGIGGGAMAVVDTVRVEDANGDFGTSNINVGPGVTVNPTSPTPAPNDKVFFTANGGDNLSGYTWSIPTNQSGATILPTGEYTAGPTGNSVDVVRATDALLNTAEVNVSVGAGISINPATPSAPPRGGLAFTATGGTGVGYVWSLTAAPSGGAIVTNGDLTGGYTAGVTGSVTDTVRVVDSVGNAATVNVAVTAGLGITPLAPSSAPRDTIGFNVTGGSGTGYVWTFVTNNSTGTINASSGAYQAGNTPSVTDTIRVTDSLLNTATVTINVTAGVSVTPSAPSTPPRGTINFAASGGSGTGFAWRFQTNASGATLGATTGAYKAGPTGNVIDSIIAADSLGNERRVDITVTGGVAITPPNPSAPPLGTVNLSATGGSGTGFVWNIPTNASGGSVVNGLYTAGPIPAVSDIVQATDSLGNSATVSVSVGGGISVNPATPSTTPRGNVSFTVTGGSGVGFSWTILTNNSGGTIGATTGAYKAGNTGNVTDVVRVTDSLGNARNVNVTVGPEVSATPSAPNIAPLGEIQFGASGGSGAGFTWQLTAAPSGGTISAAGAYKAGGTGGVTDVARVTDSLANTRLVSITVTAAVAISAGGTVAPKASKAFTATGGAGGYVFSLQTNASGGNVSATGGYTAGATPAVQDVVRVTDANGATAQATVTVGGGIAVLPVTPSAAPLATITFSASGGSGAGFTWSLLKNNSGGAMNAASGLYRAGTKGGVLDTVQVTDSLGNVKTTTVSVGGVITISPAMTDSPPKGTIAFAVQGGTGLGRTWSFQTNGSNGTIDAQSGQYIAGPKGSSTDVIRVTDSLGNTTTATIAVGPGVSVSPPTSTVEPGTKVALSVAGGSGKSYVWAIPTNLSGATVDQSGNYVAGAKRGGTDLVSVTDSLGNIGTAAITIPATDADAGADSGEPVYIGGTPVPPGEVGCGCTVVGNDDGARHVLGLGATFALAVIALVRRRRR